MSFTQVIYIDVLFTVNLYIGYCLLMLTGTLCRARINRLRLLLSSLLQGCFSLVILLPVLPSAVSIPMKAAASALFTLTAFSVPCRKDFFRLYAAFLCVSFCFAGIMLGVCIFTSSERLTYKNTAVYFDIDIRLLAISTVVCYILSRLVYVLVRRKAPKGIRYTLSVCSSGKSVSFGAIMDTGNTLTDSFSTYPVIIADVKMLSPILPEGFDLTKEETFRLLPHFRLIPFSTVGGASVMPAFRPDKVSIKNLSGEIVSDSVIIGLCDRRFGNENTGALLNARLLDEWSNTENEHQNHPKQTV